MKKRSNTSILAVLVILGIAAICYKFFEWSTLSKLTGLFDSSVSQELRLSSQLSKQYSDVASKAADFNKSASQSANLQSDAFKKLDGAYSLYEDLSSDYLILVKNNNQKFLSIRNQFKFLFGSNIKYAEKIVEDHLNYYEIEIKGAKENALITKFERIGWMTRNDLYHVNNFNNEATSIKGAKDNFYMLGSLEKYSDYSYKFDNEDELLKYAPKETGILMKQKRYYSSFYEVAKLQKKDQTNTSNYTNALKKLDQDIANLNYDEKVLFKDKVVASQKRAKNTIELISDQLSNIYTVNNKMIFNYPILGLIKFHKHPIWNCQLYGFKSSYYFSYKNTYPNAKNVEDLLIELGSIYPDTNLIDKLYDRSTMQFDNNSKEMNFTCIDKENGEKYTYSIVK